MTLLFIVGPAVHALPFELGDQPALAANSGAKFLEIDSRLRVGQCIPVDHFGAACGQWIANQMDMVPSECTNECYNALIATTKKPGCGKANEAAQIFHVFTKQCKDSMPTPAPTPVPTEHPTAEPTPTPTEVPTTLPPTTDEPSFAPSHTPTVDPTAEPTHTPTEFPTAFPTREPTEHPTREPTQLPTEEPTAFPTREPTEYPTPEPTAPPTHDPTHVPSAEPTHVPTPTPTDEPTHLPTEEPTDVPTPTPSAEPTPIPTPEPTHVPTHDPTAEPTPEPTHVPTHDPTHEPTHDPTEEPTREPTEEPTDHPSQFPTRSPTDEPTRNPTEDPTREPTAYPTRAPTEFPTTLPPTTDEPSFAPTHTPTEEPTAHPTHTPTLSPTEHPTNYPTHDPTASPTHDPTHFPTHLPTRDPTASPTQDPTHLPTHVPTSDPTHSPTHDPTNDPTREPTRDPTNEPTAEPTHAPTHVPTAEPTEAPTHEPTAEPTHTPTEVPTAEPTDSPTAEPTHVPTHVPSAEPTEVPTQPACKDLLNADVVLAVDSSFSIMDSQWAQFQDFIDKMTGDFPISKEGMNLGAVQFATRAFRYSDMEENKTKAQQARQNMAPRGQPAGDGPTGKMGQKTNMHLGVEEAMKIPGRKNVIDTLLVLTDGLPTGGTNKGGLADVAFREARAQGVKVLFVLIGTIFNWVPLPSEWMSAPPVQINSFNGLQAARSRVVDMVCKESVTTSSPRVISTIVTATPNVPPVVVFPTPPPTAQPSQSPTPVPCEPADVILVMDSSNSILESDWEKFRTFTNKLVSALPVATDKMHVGVVEYNSVAKLVTKLEDDKAELTNEIDTGLSKFTTGATRTDKAISLATGELVQSGRGGKPKLIVLLTDGLPTKRTLTDAAFAKAHAADIKVQIVTIGAVVSYLPMNPAWSTTGFPPIKMMNGYAELLTRIESILGAICQLTNVETAPPKTAGVPSVPAAALTFAPVATLEPSAQPTLTPTEVPTTLPPSTEGPSFAPTHTPTEHPTSTPTTTPTTDSPTVYKPKPGETPQYTKKYTSKWPSCKKVKCHTRYTKCQMEAACNAAAECAGFSFTTNAATGNGCLHLCGGAESSVFATGSHDYWAKGQYTMCKATAEEEQLQDIQVSAKTASKTKWWGHRHHAHYTRRRRTPAPTKITYPPIAAMSSCGKVDLALIIDASGSVSAQQWEKQMDFARALVKNMGVSPNSVNVGIVLFGRSATTKIGLTSNAAALLPHLVNRYGIDTGATNMVLALAHADAMLKRGRSGVPKVVMMLTDGQPSAGGNPDGKFAAMKRAGTSVMMVLIGPGITSQRAKNWGTAAPISISSFNALSSAFATISKEFCQVAKEAVVKAAPPTSAPVVPKPVVPTSCECKLGTAPKAPAVTVSACSPSQVKGQEFYSFDPKDRYCYHVITGKVLEQDYATRNPAKCNKAGFRKNVVIGRGSGISANYPNGDRVHCPGGRSRTTQLTIIKDPAAKSVTARVTEPATCSYHVKITTPRCAIAMAVPPPPPATKPPRITKYTTSFGGNGGGAVNSWCPDGHYINWWKIRTGSLVDRIQGRCSNGVWLRTCGGSGGGESQRSGIWGAQKMYVRTGALVDQFNGRGGNGGGGHWLDCGSGFKITGYLLRCGSLVDKVGFQCKNV